AHQPGVACGSRTNRHSGHCRSAYRRRRIGSRDTICPVIINENFQPTRHKASIHVQPRNQSGAMIMKRMGKRLITSICVFSRTANLVFGATVQEKKEDQKVDNLLTGVALTEAIYITAPDPADGVATKGVWVGGGAFQFSLQEIGFDNRLVTNAP